MNSAWSRSVDDAGSMVTNSSDVKSGLRQLLGGNGGLCFGQGARGEFLRQVELCPQVVQHPGQQVLGLIDLRIQMRVRHRVSLTSAAPIWEIDGTW